jgi:dipeptidase D
MTSTDPVLNYFKQIARIPRPSGGEEEITVWLEEWAGTRGLHHCRDATGNLFIYAPATPGMETAPTVVLQGHLDMVCERTPDAPIDPSCEPLQLIIEGEWLRANDTTLGADNGIAIAMAMALLDESNGVHPSLELLFTVDEESGLTGVAGLDGSLLQGRILLNLDSEEEGVLTVGCAGGQQTDIVLPLDWERAPADATTWLLRVHQLYGGHSGVDIHHGRANANQILAEAIERLGTTARIAHLQGGTAHNAIPRDSQATLCLANETEADAQQQVQRLEGELRQRIGTVDPNLAIALEPWNEAAAQVLTRSSQGQLLGLVSGLPHGVYRMSEEFSGKVQTSNNLATLRMTEGQLEIICSQRSFVPGELADLTARIEAIAVAHGAGATSDPGYPGWEPEMSSMLLARCKRVFHREFNREPKIEVIHAGLECSSIGERVPGMDMLSFGPTICDPHSPQERLHLPSVSAVYRFLRAVLASFGT